MTFSFLKSMANVRRRSRFRLTLGVEFDDQATKAAFSRRVEHVRSLLTPVGQRSMDNLGLLSTLFDLMEGSVPHSLPGVSRALLGHLPGSSRAPPAIAVPSGREPDPVSVVQSFNSNAGKHYLDFA